MGHTRSVAANIAFLVDDKVMRKRSLFTSDTVQDLFDAWLKMEHPKVWASVHEGEDGGVDKSMVADLSSDSMTGLMAQLMAEADAEAEAWGRQNGM